VTKYLCLEVRENLRDDIRLLAGYANLHARKHLAPNGEEFSQFHSAIGRAYGHLDTIDVTKSRRPAYLRADVALKDLASLVESKRRRFQAREERRGPEPGTFADGYQAALDEVAALIERRRGTAGRKRA